MPHHPGWRGQLDPRALSTVTTTARLAGGAAWLTVLGWTGGSLRPEPTQWRATDPGPRGTNTGLRLGRDLPSWVVPRRAASGPGSRRA
jgi:hypothetical protein